MIAKVFSASVFGIDGFPVEVEVDVGNGLPATVIVGLPDEAVKESRERVKNALLNSNFKYPARRLTVNLAPADVRKEGPVFDLPIAVGLLAATGVFKAEELSGYLLAGELSLDGTLRPVRGVLPVALAARAAGKKLVVPEQNAREASVVSGLEILPVRSLCELVWHLKGEKRLDFFPNEDFLSGADETDYGVDMSEIRGQYQAKRALEVAVSGGHNVLMSGSPGTGKTMLSMRVPTILPPLRHEEALETTKIHSVAGVLDGKHFMRTRPFRSPHHTISFAGLVGGGTYPRPGEISLAHNGVLFLDELPEFSRGVLEALRQPLEDRRVTVARASASVTFPASFMLIASMNPCPCGYRNEPRRRCRCTPAQVQRYLSRISGPLMDRIDLHVDVPALDVVDMMAETKGESSADIRARVVRARAVQAERFRGEGIFCNAQMKERHLKAHCALDEEGKKLVKMAVEELGVSARAYSRVRKVARTISDLEGSSSIQAHHLAEAFQYRAASFRG